MHGQQNIKISKMVLFRFQ